MKAKEVYNVVKELIGDINPVGETHTDNERFDNLKEMVVLAECLLHDVGMIQSEMKSFEHSRKRSGEYANSKLTMIKNGLDETILTGFQIEKGKNNV